VGELYKRVADEINTTFAIESTVELSFEEVMTPEVIEKYNAKTMGGSTYDIRIKCNVFR
jgi:hypothetical protein